MSRSLSDAAIRHLQSVVELPELSHTKYTILGTLGTGGMGIVYLARDRELGRDVALKVVRTPPAAADSVERLVREAEILARLDHPGIVPVHDVGRLPDGRAFYVMKLVRGRRLDEYVIAAIPLAERLQIFERLCEAVAFAHAQGVIHRDLKPENVMVGPFGEVLVMDWGVAKVKAAPELPRMHGAEPGVPPERGRTGAGTVLGTPGYMAPEQARGESTQVDERSDVHALGVILGTLLADGTIRAGERGSAARALQAILRKATAVDPAQRYQDAASLGADLGRFRAGLPVEAHPEGLLDQVRRLGWKYRLPLALILAYVLMRVLLLVFARA